MDSLILIISYCFNDNKLQRIKGKHERSCVVTSPTTVAVILINKSNLQYTRGRRLGGELFKNSPEATWLLRPK